MDLWEIKSNPIKQMIMAVICCAAGGLLLLYNNYNFTNTNILAGFLLGLLLLLIGVAGIFLNSKQTIIVDPKQKCITIEDLRIFKKQKRKILFSEIVDINIGYLGRYSNYVTWYYLILKLRSGENYSLFAPGRFFRGGSSRSTAEGWKRQLSKYIAA